MNEENQVSVAPKVFRVVLRAPAALFFAKGDVWHLRQIPSPAGPVDIAYTSRWITRDNITMPGHLWIEIRGSGPDLQSVLPQLANAARAGLTAMTLAANAAIDRVGVELAYDATPGITEREYFQTYVRPEQGEIAEGRVVDAEASARLFEAFHLNPEAARLFRAAGQYSHALDLWKGGDEILAVEHLWIAVEALTKVQIVSLKGATSTNTNAELAKALGVELKELDAHVREIYLLGGDADCYERARRASDGFEHAYMDFDDVHSDSVKIRDRLAKHVRASLIRLSGVGKDYEERLLASKYDQPVTYWPLVQYLHGRLIGTGENLALPGQEYPFIRWKPGVKSCEIGEDGKMQMQFTLDFTPELAEGIQFQPIRVELWRPH